MNTAKVSKLINKMLAPQMYADVLLFSSDRQLWLETLYHVGNLPPEQQAAVFESVAEKRKILALFKHSKAKVNQKGRTIPLMVRLTSLE